MNEHEHEHHPDEADAVARLSATPNEPAAAVSETLLSDQLHTISLDAAPPSRSHAYTETNVSVVREGIHRYGQPFLAYLILDGVEQRSQDLVEQYEARYLGSFTDRVTFATWAIGDLGWNDALVELRALQGMWLDDVKWDLDELWPELLTRYAVTERLGGVHAFRR